MSQLEFLGMGRCGCWRQVDPASGMVLAGYACGDCLGRALDFLEDLLYLDKVGSVSALDEDEDATYRQGEGGASALAPLPF